MKIENIEGEESHDMETSGKKSNRNTKCSGKPF
jgi:hypothetical protein